MSDDIDVWKEIGNPIRQARERYGMSQATLARRVRISPRALSDIERGRVKNPGIQVVLAIADVLYLSLDTLLAREVPQREM